MSEEKSAGTGASMGAVPGATLEGAASAGAAGAAGKSAAAKSEAPKIGSSPQITAAFAVTQKTAAALAAAASNHQRALKQLKDISGETPTILVDAKYYQVRQHKTGYILCTLNGPPQGKGRPKGSKNKPKAKAVSPVAALEAAAPAAPVAAAAAAEPAAEPAAEEREPSSVETDVTSPEATHAAP